MEVLILLGHVIFRWIGWMGKLHSSIEVIVISQQKCLMRKMRELLQLSW